MNAFSWLNEIFYNAGLDISNKDMIKFFVVIEFLKHLELPQKSKMGISSSDMVKDNRTE